MALNNRSPALGDINELVVLGDKSLHNHIINKKALSKNACTTTRKAMALL